VGIDNGGPARHSEYFPQKPFENLPEAFKDSIYQLERAPGQLLFDGAVRSDAYLKFLVEELKPEIDRKYRTRTHQANTFIMGSSMGGLISLYAICEYPEVFGGAACLSTHWPGVFSNDDNPIPEIFFQYLKDNLPNPEGHKLYFDFGTETLDALYQMHQRKVDQIVWDAGYENKREVLTLKFQGHAHMERDWQRRLHVPLTFLMPSP
jgi:pimeloyl-ACP methyl ester carboxylesterase